MIISWEKQTDLSQSPNITFSSFNYIDIKLFYKMENVDIIESQINKIDHHDTQAITEIAESKEEVKVTKGELRRQRKLQKWLDKKEKMKESK